jgi:hypothetical protein
MCDDITIAEAQAPVNGILGVTMRKNACPEAKGVI